VQPPKLSPEARARYMAFSEEDFNCLADQLAPSDRHSLSQSRFLLEKQLGSLSQVKVVKSAQVAADEACKRLQQAKSDYATKQKRVSEAMQAAFQQKTKVAQLEVELDDAVAKAKAVVAKDAEPKAPGAQACDVGVLLGYAKQLDGIVGTSVENPNVQLTEDLLGPLRALLAGVLAAQPQAAAAAADGTASAPAGAPSPAKGGSAAAGAAAPAEGQLAGDAIDVDLEGDAMGFATSDSFMAATEDFVGSDIEKRKFVEELQAHLKQQHENATNAKKQRLG